MSFLLVMFTFSIKASADAGDTTVTIRIAPEAGWTLCVGTSYDTTDVFSEGQSRYGVTYSGGKIYINGEPGYIYDIDSSGVVIETVASGVSIDDNYGTINKNNGTVLCNEETITVNNGTVNLNRAQININKGIVNINNCGDTRRPNACISENSGTVSDNAQDITINKGTVVLNSGSGVITTNIGSVTNNEGTVTTNTGRVENNSEFSGKVVNNTTTGIIARNGYGAFVTTNNGHVYQNESEREIGGSGFVTTEPEPEYVPEAPDTPDGMYMKGLDNLDTEIEELSAKVASGEFDGVQTIKYSSGDSLPLFLMKTLANCPNVNLEYTCKYEDEDYKFLITGGKGFTVDENVPWWGVKYLEKFFPNLAKEEKDK